MRKTKKWLALGFAAALVVSCTACGAQDEGKDGTTYEGTVLDEDQTDVNSGTESDYIEENSEDEGVTISEEELILQYGRGTSVDVFGAEGDITWDVDNPDIVEIEASDSYAMVTGKSVGETTITVRAEQGEVSCHVKVVSAGLYLQDDRGNSGAWSSGTYALGKQHTYSAFNDGTPVLSSDLTWSSMDEAVASVKDGVVTMESEGVTYISATDKDGNTAYAPVWVSDTDDEFEFETKIPGKGLFLDSFTGYDEHILDHADGEGSSYYISDVYDNGKKIDAGKLTWSVENNSGNAIELNKDETTAEEVSILYTGSTGEGLLIATNPDTGDEFRYLIVVLDLGD